MVVVLAAVGLAALVYGYGGDSLTMRNLGRSAMGGRRIGMLAPEHPVARLDAEPPQVPGRQVVARIVAASAVVVLAVVAFATGVVLGGAVLAVLAVLLTADAVSGWRRRVSREASG